MAAIQRATIPFPGPGTRLRGRGLIVLAVLGLTAAALAQVNQFSRLTSTGYEIEELRQRQAEKLAANHQIEAQVAQLSSLARVDWEARTRLQMQPARRRLYIEVNQVPPAHQTLPTRYLAAERAAVPPPDDDGESWWGRLLQRWPF